MSRLALLRHAQSEWNAEGRWQGWADPPLSHVGERHSAAVGRLLARAELGARLSGPVISSDLRRARQTAETLTAQLGLPVPCQLDAQLREIDVGAWSGLRRREIAQGWPDWLRQWDLGLAPSAPGGERRGAFDARVVAACHRWLVAAGGCTRLVVTHGGVIRSVARSAGAPVPSTPNLGGVLLESLPGSAVVAAAWKVTPLPTWPMGAELTRQPGGGQLSSRAEDRPALDQPLPCQP